MTRAREFANFGSDAPSAIGTAGQALLINSGATAYEWAEAGGGATEFIASSGAISNAATVSFTQFDASKYDHYQFHMQHVLPVTDGKTLRVRVSTDGGSNYDATNGNYHSNATTDETSLFVTSGGVGNASGEFGVSGIFFLFSPHNSAVGTYGTSTGVTMTGSGSVLPLHGPHGERSGVHLTTAAVDAVQFLFTSGNIASGEIVMYGIKNS